MYFTKTVTDKINTVEFSLIYPSSGHLRNTYCDIKSLNHFVVIALCMAVWLQQTQSVLKYDGKLNEKVYKKNGMETVDLSCGKVPESFVAIEWARYISNQSTKILKIYNDTTEKHYDGYTSSKYSISETEPTSLLIKNIEISDTGYYICHTVGEQVGYKYTTLLHVVGKSLLYIFCNLLDKVFVTITPFCTGMCYISNINRHGNRHLACASFYSGSM